MIRVYNWCGAELAGGASVALVSRYEDTGLPVNAYLRADGTWVPCATDDGGEAVTLTWDLPQGAMLAWVLG